MLVVSNTNENGEEKWKSCKIGYHLGKNPLDKINLKMVIRVMMTSVEMTIRNHVFVFNQDVYHQTEDGAIGVGLAGEVSNLFMFKWDQTFFKRVKKG